MGLLIKEHHENLLSLIFSDVEHRVNSTDILFDEHMAGQVLEFFERMDGHKDLLVHCRAGISRSGAVGTIAKEFFQVADSDFVLGNDFILPNQLVLRLLKEAWNSKTDIPAAKRFSV